MYPPLGQQPIQENLYTDYDTAKAAKNAAFKWGSGKSWSEKRAILRTYIHAKIALYKEIRKNESRGREACTERAEEKEEDDTILLEWGAGECGVRGNTKVFKADLKECTNTDSLAGDIEGAFGTMTYTYTQLVGVNNNALLYQVFLTADALNRYWFFVAKNYDGRCDGTFSEHGVPNCGFTEDRLMQSQLTTLTTVDEVQHRTRSAQGFETFGAVGKPKYTSFYREKKVAFQPEEGTTSASEVEDFYSKMSLVQQIYNIDDSDMGAWRSGETGGTIPSGLVGDEGIPKVRSFLEEVFQ